MEKEEEVCVHRSAIAGTSHLKKEIRILIKKGFQPFFFGFGSSIEFAEKSRERNKGSKVAQLGHAQSQLKRATTPPSARTSRF